MPFPGNRDPRWRCSAPIAQKIQDLYPDINLRPAHRQRRTSAARAIYRNYVASAGPKFDRNNYDFKVNYNHSPANQVWGKYSRMGANVTSPQAYLGYDGAAHRRHDRPA